MKREFVLLRKAAIIAVAAASIVGAVAAIWVLVTRGELTTMSNPQLLAIIALILLPGATAIAWVLDRRAAHNRIRSHDDDLFETPEDIELAQEPEVTDESGAFVILEEPPASDAGRTASPREPHRRRRQGSRQNAQHG